ncbi:MAG: nucleotidyltransferase family protein [Elusimicrobia bacterium]|nr:nucleotidyltransferase family protein [Elusimicrobiota bacterium]
MLNKEEIIKSIQKHRSSIQEYGVRRLGLFGSYARGENIETSDIDFIVEFNTKSFDNYMGLKFYLEEIFKCKVDLIIPNTIKPRLRETILKEVTYAPGL